MFKALRGALVAILAASSLVAVASAPAHAVAGPFTCSPDFFQASSGIMYQYSASTNSYTQMPAATNNLSSLNPIGYNNADNYIYGVSGSTTLYKIFNDGSHSAAMTVTGTGMQTTAGDFVANNYFLTAASGGMTLVNTSTLVGTTITPSASWAAYDLAFNPVNSTIYGLNGQTLYIGVISYTAGVPTSVAVTTKTVSTTVDGSSYGASYVDSAGNAYFFNNGTKNLWEVSAAQLAAASPTATLITNGAVTGSMNDGASCNTASSPLAPVAATLQPTSVTGTTATLNGAVTTQSRTGSNITSGNLQICYASNSTQTAGILSSGQTCTNTTPATQAQNVGNAQVSLSVTGLTAGTTYWYQIVTTDANGLQGIGQLVSFTTPGGSPTTYTVTFNNNGGSGSMSNQTGSSAAALTTNTFTRTGYTFAGWATAANGSQAYADGASYPFASSTTLYAIWTANAPTTYTVTFNNNGGSGSMSNQTGSSAAALSSNTFTRTGYTFAGWNTLADGTGTNYADNASYGFGADVTLYAKWTANAPSTYTVTFDSNGGNGSMSNQTGSSAAALSSNAFSRGGYTFTGWNTAANGSGTSYSNGASYPFTSSVTLYAQWEEIDYVITYDPQGGSSVPSANFGTNARITLPGAPTRSGYTFTGWFTAPTGGSQANSPYRPGSGSVTLYAQWAPVTNTITYYPQNGGPSTGGSYVPGGSVNLPSAPSYPGYTFNGWFPAANGGSPVTSPYTPAAGGASLYAQWTKNAPATYSVNFNSQGGSSVAAGSYTAGACVALPAAPTRDGYTFKGWAVSPDGGATVASPYCPTGNGDITLFGQWTKNADPTPTARGPVTVVIAGFADGSSKLTWTIKKKIDNFLKKYSDYKVIQCVGFTEGPTILKTDKALSIARATNACDYALAGLAQGLTKLPVKFGNDTVQHDSRRRVEITLSDN